MDFARSQLEWMHSSVAEAFENRRENMFATRYLRTCQSCDELAHLPQASVAQAGGPAGPHAAAPPATNRTCRPASTAARGSARAASAR
jgi:hypothetical protein